MELDGQLLERGDHAYEEARRASVWNGRLPDRFPDLILQAASERDVGEAVRIARQRGLRVGVRSGGHSWSANHLRDGGLLLDVSRLDTLTVDVASQTARVGPGRKGHELCEQLESSGLFFPAGHCKGVGVGGYLLQGGYGWNSRVLGPACESVLGVEVVTAAGEFLHADGEENSDLFWAARGAGPGFPGVVTSFELRLQAQPAVCGASFYAYPIELLDEVYSWAHEIGPEVDRRVEMQLLMSRSFEALGIEQTAIVIGAPVFADSEGEARQAVAPLDTCPVRDRALFALPFAPFSLGEWYDAVMGSYPAGHRFSADNMWTHAPIGELIPGLRHIAETLPPWPSHFLWLNWGPSPLRADMAYSVEDQVYLALYAGWADRAADETVGSWPSANMAAMEHLSSGIQLADENLAARPAPFASPANMARLDEIRAQRDPGRLFHSWMGRS